MSHLYKQFLIINRRNGGFLGYLERSERNNIKNEKTKSDDNCGYKTGINTIV